MCLGVSVFWLVCVGLGKTVKLETCGRRPRSQKLVLERFRRSLFKAVANNISDRSESRIRPQTIELK